MNVYLGCFNIDWLNKHIMVNDAAIKNWYWRALWRAVDQFQLLSGSYIFNDHFTQQCAGACGIPASLRVFVFCAEHWQPCCMHACTVSTGWSKSICAPDDYSTKNTQKYSILNSFITEYIWNVDRAILNAVFKNTVQRINKCLETGVGHFEHYL
jgi:hemerythrin